MNDLSKQFVSVIIPVYNDVERLKICLEALENQTYPRDLYEVIVVNNDPSQTIEPHVVNFNNVRLICESHRSSYAARNKGVFNARGTVIAFTDSDCIPKSDWIEKGVNNLLNEPHCGLVAGRIEIFCSDPENPTAIELYEKITAFHQKMYVDRLKFGATANLFTFKSIINRVGHFNYTVLSSGDSEWGNRVFKAGYKQIYADDTCVSHPALKTFGQRFRKRIRIIRGKYKLGTLNFSLRLFMRRLALPLNEAKKVILEGKYDEFLKGKKQKFKFAAVFFFDSYVWTFGSLVITLFGRKKQ
jgi:cellulose synthase/poly-beta-1,6-N-acetylglucosamine synthase-like glycosyltransferase